MLGPALAKSRLGVDEVVTTLLLNFIVLLGVSALLDGPMKDPTAMGWPQSVALLESMELGKLVPQTRLHTGLIAALVLPVLFYHFERSSRGRHVFIAFLVSCALLSVSSTWSATASSRIIASLAASLVSGGAS